MLIGFLVEVASVLLFSRVIKYNAQLIKEFELVPSAVGGTSALLTEGNEFESHS